MAYLHAHRPDLLLFNGRPLLYMRDGHFRNFQVYFKSQYLLSLRFRLSPSPSSGSCRVAGCRRNLFRCWSLVDGDNGKVEVIKEIERPPFDINLAVILAGFSFEAYTTPSDNNGPHEVDAAGCKTVYLSESFLREIYDGQLFIKLKKGFNMPAMDPWGTSDPYVVMEMDGQIAKSKIKWGTKEPTWNEDFSLNIKLSPNKTLQVAAWDANLVTPHKRMGNAGISLELLCDGNTHEVKVELEGMGGGGNLLLEISYKSFGDIDAEKKWWNVPFVSAFFRQNGFESALKAVVGSDTVPARKFVEYAFGQMKSLNVAYPQKDKSLSIYKFVAEEKSDTSPQDIENLSTSLNVETLNESNGTDGSLSNSFQTVERNDPGQEMQFGGEAPLSDKWFWKFFANVINQSVVQKLGLPIPERVKWDGFDLLSKVGSQSRNIAEAGYVESGLATPKVQDINTNGDKDKGSGPLSFDGIQSSLPDVKKVTQDLLRQTDSVLGAFMVLTATVSQFNKDGVFLGKDTSTEKDDDLTNSINENFPSLIAASNLEENKAEEMKALFSSAESAMEAWAMLATSLGHPSFIKSEFEKICFLDNESTDTQVAIWRDTVRRRLVVAFRGTEQSKWKDLRTDLMLVPAGLNPERIGGDFKQEVQVHSGFLSAYDSVRIRILSLIKAAIGSMDDGAKPQPLWHVYVTGHSLGGALATLLALELSSSQLAKHGAISVTMYNFGSPRVGNRRFAELYNEKVKDSWRVVNHRDIIPSVPRLMGYSHVAQPVYLAAGDFQGASENIEVLGVEGSQGDMIGEATPDVIMTEFMKGEKELIEKILQTEINIYRSIRDGSALMQHMEDFYYITLLEKVRSNYQNARLRTRDEGSGSDSTV